MSSHPKDGAKSWPGEELKSGPSLRTLAALGSSPSWRQDPTAALLIQTLLGSTPSFSGQQSTASIDTALISTSSCPWYCQRHELPRLQSICWEALMPISSEARSGTFHPPYTGILTYLPLPKANTPPSSRSTLPFPLRWVCPQLLFASICTTTL